MSEEEKKNSLELILRPTNLQTEQCSSIDLYYKKSIEKFMHLYDELFKTDLVINVRIVKQNGRIVAKGDLTHKIFKVNGKFRPIKTTFEHKDCCIDNSYIIFPDGSKAELSNVNEINNDEKHSNIVDAKEYETEIPEEYQDNPFLTVCREFTEMGNDHWINFHWLSLTICDGIYFKMICEDKITIKDYLVFDNKMCYDINKKEDGSEIKIISTNWLDCYTGFTITASDT